MRMQLCRSCLLRYPTRFLSVRRFHSSNSRPHGVLDLLEERGYVNQIAGDRNVMAKLLETRNVGFYAGIDPTAPSLHLGHLLPIMVLFWLYHHGHYTVSLVGGATAKVGDPSGRLTSRAATAASVIQSNLEAMSTQVAQLWESAKRYGRRHGQGNEKVGEVELLNNSHWLDGLNVLKFLHMMGNGMRVGAMLGRDTVRNKMEKGDGMSFSEFTYPLLQAWDWWQMYSDRMIQIQVGGSDQYGNIIAGIDAVKHIAQNHAEAAKREKWFDVEGSLKEEYSPMGLTVPLLTTSSGEKFGKSAGNAVWLDRTLTSPFDLYGFLLRSADDDVERYLKLFTFVSIDVITAVMAEHRLDPGKRRAQHLLASEVLELVHGPEEASKIHAEHQTMRSPTLASLSLHSSTAVEPDSANRPTPPTPRTKLPRSLVHNVHFSRILYHAGLAATRSEGARTIAKGGAYVASQASRDRDELVFLQIKDQQVAHADHLLADGMLVVRIGKWKVRIIEVVADGEYDATGQEAPGWAEFKAALSR